MSNCEGREVRYTMIQMFGRLCACMPWWVRRRSSTRGSIHATGLAAFRQWDAQDVSKIQAAALLLGVGFFETCPPLTRTMFFVFVVSSRATVVSSIQIQSRRWRHSYPVSCCPTRHRRDAQSLKEDVERHTSRVLEDQSYHICSCVRGSHLKPTLLQPLPRLLHNPVNKLHECPPFPDRPDLDRVITTRVSLRSHIPEGAREAWAHCLLAALCGVVSHTDTRAWSDLLGFWRLVLRCDPSDGVANNTANALDINSAASGSHGLKGPEPHVAESTPLQRTLCRVAFNEQQHIFGQFDRTRPETDKTKDRSQIRYHAFFSSRRSGSSDIRVGLALVL